MNPTSVNDGFGLFGYTDGATISNVYLNTPRIIISGSGRTQNFYSAGICGRADNSTIDGCQISNGTISNSSTCSSGYPYVAGMVGYAGGTSVISNCTNTATVSGTGTNARTGGMVGSIAADGSITGCTNSGVITGNHATGGMSAYGTGKIDNCKNTASINGSYGTTITGVGGIVGQNNEGSNITNCTNSGAITGTVRNSSKNTAAGGISGRNFGKIESCSNTGKITTNSGAMAGGISGSNTLATISKCKNTGEVTGTGTRTDEVGELAEFGGISGVNQGGTITLCGNEGNITSTKGAYVGGVCGMHRDASTTEGDAKNNAATMSTCYNTGKVQATQFAGGLAGRSMKIKMACVISNSYNYGSVSGTKSGSIIGNNTGTTIPTGGGDVYALGTVCSGKTIGNGDDNTGVKLRSDAFMRSSNFASELGSSWKLIAKNSVTVPPVQTWQSGTALNIPLVYLTSRASPITYENGKISTSGTTADIRLTAKGYYLNCTSISGGTVSYEWNDGGSEEIVASFMTGTPHYNPITTESKGILHILGNGIIIEITKDGVKVPIDLGITFTYNQQGSHSIDSNNGTITASGSGNHVVASVPRFDGVKITPIKYSTGSSVVAGNTQLVTTTGSSSGVTTTVKSLTLVEGGSNGYGNVTVAIGQTSTTVQFTYNYAPITILTD